MKNIWSESFQKLVPTQWTCQQKQEKAMYLTGEKYSK